MKLKKIKNLTTNINSEIYNLRFNKIKNKKGIILYLNSNITKVKTSFQNPQKPEPNIIKPIKKKTKICYFKNKINKNKALEYKKIILLTKPYRTGNITKTQLIK